MKVIDKAMLALFRGPGVCEWCGRWKPRREAAHVFTKGMGGATRLDVRQNLCSLCRDCHQAHHDGMSPRQLELLQKVADRESKTVDYVREYIYALRRSEK